MRVACLGDSTTASTEFSDYPKILQSMLGTNYLVGNFGVITATVLLNTNKPYLNQSSFENAQNFRPNIIIIMLGTNDAQVNNYLSIDKFKHDYEELINRISASTSNARIFLVKPPPIFKNTLNLSNTNLVEGVIPRIEQLSNERSLPLIDVYDILIKHPECFADGVHPNYDGAKVIASEIYRAIVNDS
ncbi:MAG TPA: GDSL-type esterase/lipase family protein [Candidatus Sulfotelmatobacter sp.]|nr:GDSL-type esterase/lipase family protein [Candidatus Sulfotelmatobacter sp.]